MTKKLTTLLMLLTLCLSTCALTACGDDDDNNNSYSASFDMNLLYGYWDGRTISNGVNAGIYFGRDGQGYEDEGSGSSYERWDITYSVSGNKITIVDADDPNDPYYYTVYSITSTKLVLLDEDGDNLVFMKSN